MARTSELRDLDTRLSERRMRGARMWDETHESRRSQADMPARPFRSPLGWLGALILANALVVAVAIAVLLVPPVLDCRQQSAQGFFAGDGFAGCLERRVTTRFRDLDGRLRQIILKSGR